MFGKKGVGEAGICRRGGRGGAGGFRRGGIGKGGNSEGRAGICRRGGGGDLQYGVVRRALANEAGICIGGVAFCNGARK